MQLEHRFTVPVPPDVAWAALLDPERVAPCFPGATLSTVEGPEFTGTVKVRLGPVAMLYKGKGRFASTDAEARRLVLEASGRDSRGNGTASAVVTASLRPEAAGTAVKLVTDLTITGRPAQLGRGLITEVGGKIVATFAGCLADRLTSHPAEPAVRAGPAEPAVRAGPAEPAVRAGPAEPAVPSAAGAGVAAKPPTGPEAAAPRSRRLAEPVTLQPGRPAEVSVPTEIDLIEVARVPVLKRLVPLLLAVLVVVLVLRRLRRRSR